MGKALRRLGLGLLAAIVVLGLVAASPPGRGFIGEKLALRDGAQAYLIGYPLVTMHATRQALIQPPARMNAFIHTRYLPDARKAVNVVSPSRDMFYSSAWLDLREGPVIIEQPDMGDRFWLMPVLDAWTNVVADPGSRTLGNAPHTLLIAGPDWTGQAPAGMTLYRSTTNLAWAILRIQVDNGLDGIAELQEGFRVAPLSNRREYRDPAVVERPREVTDVRAAVDALTGEEFFTALADQLRDQPLVPDDPAAADTLAKAGIVIGQPYDVSGFSAAQRRGIAEVPGRVQQGMTDAFDSGEASYVSNGWRVPPMDIGDYGTEYPLRAVIAREGLGANLPEDAVYASTSVDNDGEPLIGGRRYAIDLPADMPVNAFWSITAYDERGNLLPGDARTLSVSGQAGTGPRRILVSSSRPDEADGWLRIPASGNFRLLMRLYWPEPEVLNNQWTYPPVRAQ
jgi:hypothetical protein